MKIAPTPRPSRLAAVLLAAMTSALPSAHATDGVWLLNNNGLWSASANWTGSFIADGTGSIADFSQLNLTASRTVTIDTTPRTVGTLLFGDSTAAPSFSNYTIAASGGGTLTFNNSGSAAIITQGANSGANTISAPVSLADSLNINNNSASSLTVSGTVSASTAGTKTITNAGSGAGGVTVSGIISNGTGSVAVVQNSATSTLTLGGANTFDTGVQIKQGTLLVNNTTALGTGTVLLGDTSGSADATLAINSFTPANNITVQAGSSGTLSISNNGTSAARPAGNILLNNDLTITADGARTGSNAGAMISTSGTISGTGDLNLNVTGNLSTSNNTGSPQMDNLSVAGAVTTTGDINNIGAGAGRALISGNISAASSVNQNSATSMLTLSGTNTYTGATNVNAGILRIGANTSLPTSSVTTVASGATLQFGTSVTLSANQALTISGHGTSYSSGALESTNNATYSSDIVLAGDSTVSSTLANTIFTLAGPITGSGNTLTATGVGNHAISGVIGTGTGGLIKEGTGTTTLSGANTYTGLTQINNGALLVSSAGALGGGGNITFDGGSLRHSATNELDYGNRIVNSTGPVAIDTNSRNVTYSNIAGSNTGGLAKLGAGRLTLSGTNTFTGPIAVNTGVLAVSATSALPSIGTGQIFIDDSGALNTGGAYGSIQAWLDSDNISTASTGAIALIAGSSENINFTGYDTLSLGASTSSTYTGTITSASGGYRLGGGGATLTLSGTNALTGANALTVANGAVTLTGANNLTGATTVASNTLSLSGAAGSLASSAVTVSPGATLAIVSNTAIGSVTRASSVTLNRGTLTVQGNATANTTDAIANALTIGSGGNSIVTLTANAGKNVSLNVGSLTRTAGGTALIRGADLGVSAIASTVAGDTNLFFTTPNLVGNGGTGTDRSIFVGVVGDTSASGTGFGATGGLLTQDATNGVRRMTGSDYKASLTDGQTDLDNVQLTSTGTTTTATINSATTINSLSLNSTTATGANVQVGGTGTLTLNSGVIYANSVTATTASGISNTIDFNQREGIILAGGTASLTLSGVLSNTNNKGLTIYAPSRTVTLSGADANTYTGTTTVNGGTLALNKTAGINAITGDMVINSGGSVSQSTSNQIADAANVTVNGGSLTLTTETFNDLNLNSGTAATGAAVSLTGNLSIAGNASLTTNIVGTLNVAGSTNLSDGGTITLVRSQNTTGNYDSITTLGALNITNRSSGAYTAITINHGSSLGQSGGKLVLNGDVTFTGNSTNTNTVLIDAIKGTGRQGVVELTAATGDRTFNVGNGAAATDLKITAALLDGSGASGLVKTGLGTLALSGANTYSGNTTVSAGGLTLADGGSLTFYIGANGVNNSVTGTGAANFSGSFNFDLSGANTTGGNSWTIVNVATLNESFTGTFLVDGFTETGVNSGIWTLGQYTFTEATGILAYGIAIPEPSTYALFVGAGLLLFTVIRRKTRASSSA
ncbi:MAG: putative outer rane autotransporter [Rariglobus sp.]|jgi:autotransporter-associated beta strand protein|nr:putative outer rane autotransporter [Rariglobus sp.]